MLWVKVASEPEVAFTNVALLLIGASCLPSSSLNGHVEVP
jgi:hypothetical protein